MTSLHKRNCPACSNPEAAYIGSKNSFELFACSRCRTVYTDRIPSTQECENYDKYYHEGNLTVPSFVQDRLFEILTEFEGYRSSGRMLDIGFGAGLMLEVAEKLSWDPFGLEVSESAILNAKKKGFNVFHGTLVNAAYPDNYFDVVTASEILEHLSEPHIDLKEIARILRPGGLFWGTTPSAKSISYRILKMNWSVLTPPEHLQLYSREGAFQMLQKAGFTKVWFKTHGVNPSEILNQYMPVTKKVDGNDRVASGYKLNEQLSKGGFRKMIKNSLNNMLSVSGLGDSLKIYAEVKK